METANKRSKASAAEPGAVLPPDVVWEILLRLPAWSLWRFRAVCRLWRSVLSDSSFVKAHAALRPGFILALAGAHDRMDVMDLSGSGHVVRQISIPAAEEGVPPLPAHPGPFYLFRAGKRTRVLDPDTGAVAVLPFDDIDVPPLKGASWCAPEYCCYTLGHDSSTDYRKVLRIATRFGPAGVEQLCDVLTLGDDHGCCWRRRPSSPIHIASYLGSQGIIIQGFLYFMSGKTFADFNIGASRDVMDLANSVAPFNLETEEWRPAFRGPPGIPPRTNKHRLKLAKLSNNLVMMHFDHAHPVVHLWFATDLERSLWVKKHSVPRELLLPSQQMCIRKAQRS